MEFQKEIIKKKGVHVILYKLNNQNIKYLVLKRAEGWIGWELLKGGVNDSETFSETAKREVKEESGLDVEVFQSKEESVFYSEKNNVKTQHSMKVFFGKVVSEDIKLSEEHSDFKWLALNDAINLLFFDNLKELLKKVNEEIIEHENLKLGDR